MGEKMKPHWRFFLGVVLTITSFSAAFLLVLWIFRDEIEKSPAVSDTVVSVAVSDTAVPVTEEKEVLVYTSRGSDGEILTKVDDVPTGYFLFQLENTYLPKEQMEKLGVDRTCFHDGCISNQREEVAHIYRPGKFSVKTGIYKEKTRVTLVCAPQSLVDPEEIYKYGLMVDWYQFDSDSISLSESNLECE